MEEDNLATELLHDSENVIWIIYDLWFRWKGNIQKAPWNIAKYNTAKYHLMYKGDLFLPYFFGNHLHFMFLCVTIQLH